MAEPTELTAMLAEWTARHDPGTRLHTLGRSLMRAHSTNRDRRAAVLSYPDLAARLTQPPLDYSRPEVWNGYIPPAMVNLGESETLRTVGIGSNGQQVVRFNQLCRRTRGEQQNDAPERAALLEISAEAWRRDHELPADPSAITDG